MTKDILFGKEGREQLRAGVNILSNAVSSTLGAKGKNVIIGRDFGLPIITKDGVTVAKNIMINDEVQNMGASLVKEVASLTAEVAGDGTTTATVLAQSILNLGIDAINEGHSQIYLKSGIDKAVKAVVAELKKISKPIKGKGQLINIASISANNDKEIGKLIGEAVSHVGVDGVITIEESGIYETSVQKIDGFKFGQGYIDKLFALRSKKEEVVLENVAILMYDKKISTMGEILPVLTELLQRNEQLQMSGEELFSLLIIAEDVTGEAIKSLITNHLGSLPFTCCCVKTPGYGPNRYDLMNDIAIMTGGLFVNEDLGIKINEVSMENLGRAKKVTITHNKTTIVGGQVDQGTLEHRINDVREMMKTPKDHDVKFLKHRLANMTNGVASIRVGGTSEVEVKEKVDRIDDAMNATISSLEEGYVSGGGSAYLQCLSALDKLKIVNEDEGVGVEIIRKAIQTPFKQILSNGGMNGDEYIEIIKNEEYGFGVNIKTGEVENLLRAGVIDPTKVSRVALENAASIAGTFLTTDCIILNVSED